MAATSQPLATRAALRAFERGGNAVDAALAAAAVLCVTEPHMTGVGGDAFAIVWDGSKVHGLDAAGPAPLLAPPNEVPADLGPRSITVPGAVAGWAALADRFGRLGLDAALVDAIDAAEHGVAIGGISAALWAEFGGPPELGPPPALGDRLFLPELAQTLRSIAESGPSGFYHGKVGRAITSSSWLDEGDLSRYRPRWVEPLTTQYRDFTICELPPPTQGVVALEALGMLALGEPDIASQVHCTSLALEDGLAQVRDGADVSTLLDPSYLAVRRAAHSQPTRELSGGTVYACCAEFGGLAVSFIQSLYMPFGSRVVAPGTGVVLQNRGSCFAVAGAVEPGKRPFHTLIPGMVLAGSRLLGPFGVMGGFIQAQSHVQLISALLDERLDPQAALDRPRFRVEGDTIYLEEGLWDAAQDLRRHHHNVELSRDRWQFGAGQAIMTVGDVLLGGSDARRDGYAAGF